MERIYQRSNSRRLSFGAAFAATVEGIFIATFGISGLESYAWRHLFLTVLIIAVIALAVRFTMEETPIFEDIKERKKIRKTPFLDLFRRPYRRDFLQVMIIMTELFFYAYSLFAFVPVILEHKPSVLPIGEADTIYSYGTYGALAGAIFFGTLSQYLGRRNSL